MTKIFKTVVLPMVFALAMVVSAGHVIAASSAQNPLIIDVRTEAEWAGGHLEGAVLIPHDRIGKEIAKLPVDKDEKIYLYCRSGRRTGIAMDVLQKAGYQNLINLETMENAAKVLNRAVVK